jgi:photosystem P840 reaction center protein PscD
LKRLKGIRTNPFVIYTCFGNLQIIKGRTPVRFYLQILTLQTMRPQLSRPDTAMNQVRVSTSGPWSGNAVHKAQKYFITSAKRDRSGKLQLEISPASGRRTLLPTKGMIDKVISGEIELYVLTTQPDIGINLQQKVLDNENRYVIDFDKRGVKWTMRDIPVFYDTLHRQLSVEIDRKTYTLDEFFK